MLRPTIADDLPRLLEIRDASGVDALSDPALVTVELLSRLIAAGAIMVWDETGEVTGFAAVDDAAIHLLVDTGARGKGVGRALLAWACSAVRDAGQVAAIIGLPAGSTAARHYRAAAWIVTGTTQSGELVFQKPL